MHCRVISCNNFPRPLQPLPSTLSYVTVWCSEPCCPGWNLKPVSKLVFLTWQHRLRLVGNLPYPFFVKPRSWCLTLNPGGTTGRVKCTAELERSAGCLSACSCIYCLWLIPASCGDRMMGVLLFPVLSDLRDLIRVKFSTTFFYQVLICLQVKNSVSGKSPEVL